MLKILLGLMLMNGASDYEELLKTAEALRMQGDIPAVDQAIPFEEGVTQAQADAIIDESEDSLIADLATRSAEDNVRSAARELGLDEQTMMDIARTESNLNPRARNPRSSAKGLFQFIDSTTSSLIVWVIG
jgi:soluble lytic murein transglycosylase-like protein